MALVIVVIVMGARTWGRLDEVQRRQTVTWLAATGAGAILARPLLLIAQPMLHFADPAAAGWYGAIGIGLAIALAQWWQRS